MGELSIMGRPGDTRIMWNPRDRDEVENARRAWDDLVRNKRFLGFRVKRDGEKGEQVREFDPEASKLIIVPPMAGGAPLSSSDLTPRAQVKPAEPKTEYVVSASPMFSDGTAGDPDSHDEFEAIVPDISDAAASLQEYTDRWWGVEVRNDLGRPARCDAIDVTITRRDAR